MSRAAPHAHATRPGGVGRSAASSCALRGHGRARRRARGPEGETVDYAGYLDPFALKSLARGVASRARCRARGPAPGLRDTTRSLIRAGRTKSFAVVGARHGLRARDRATPQGFALSRRGASPRPCAPSSSRPSCRQRRATPASERWFGVEVRPSRATAAAPKPSGSKAPGSPWSSSAGTVPAAAAPAREVAYRARLPNGLEFTLVRESRSAPWFARATL